MLTAVLPPISTWPRRMCLLSWEITRRLMPSWARRIKHHHHEMRHQTLQMEIGEIVSERGAVSALTSPCLSCVSRIRVQIFDDFENLILRVLLVLSTPKVPRHFCALNLFSYTLFLPCSTVCRHAVMAHLSLREGRLPDAREFLRQARSEMLKSSRKQSSSSLRPSSPLLMSSHHPLTLNVHFVGINLNIIGQGMVNSSILTPSSQTARMISCCWMRPGRQPAHRRRKSNLRLLSRGMEKASRVVTMRQITLCYPRSRSIIFYCVRSRPRLPGRWCFYQTWCADSPCSSFDPGL